MIKVCHIVNLITGKSDGVYTHLKMIFQNYDRNRFKHYLIFQGGSIIETEVKSLGVEVVVLDLLKKKFSIGSFIHIYKILKKFKIDIVHAHLIKPYTLGGLVNIFARKKLVFNYHGLFIKDNPYYNIAEKTVYYLSHYLINLFSKVDAVLVPSKRSRELLISESKMFPQPFVYYNGYNHQKKFRSTDLELIKQLADIKSTYRIIAIVSRLEIEKRIDDAIKIFSKVSANRSNLILLIFGNGPLKTQLMDLCNNFKVDSRVIFFDYVPEVIQYFNYFDILLFTSQREGMPLTMWEAMANSVPVVAPDVGGFKEILEENNCGLVYEPGNLTDAEDKLTKLLDEEPYRKRLGENGRIAIESKYTEEKFIQQIEKVYSELINS